MKNAQFEWYRGYFSRLKEFSLGRLLCYITEKIRHDSPPTAIACKQQAVEEQGWKFAEQTHE